MLFYTGTQERLAYGTPTVADPRGLQPVPADSPEFLPPRIALVIGNTAYAQPLPNAVQDAHDMSMTLRSVGFTVLEHTNLDRKAMWQAVRTFGAALTSSSIGLFYFAGHGIQVDGKNYLLPVGGHLSSEAEVEEEGMDVDVILRLMGQVKNPLNIVILDACRTNPFSGNYMARQQGLARMEGPIGTLIAYATTPGMWASDGAGRNGVYTKHLLAAMTRPGLTLEQVFKQVRRAVRDETHGKQVPWESSALLSEFTFVWPVPPAPGPALPAALEALEPRVPAVADATARATESGHAVAAVPTASVTVRTPMRGAQVWLNGQEYGVAPVVAAVVPGTYEVKVQKKGYVAWTTTLTLTAGERRTLQAVLSRERVVASVASARRPTPAREPRQEPPPRRTVVATPRQEPPRRTVSRSRHDPPPRQVARTSGITTIPTTVFRTGKRLVHSGVNQVKRVWRKIF